MTTNVKRQRSVIRADLLWKELLESFLYFALEIFYPQLYAVVDHSKPPSFLNKELRVPGLHKSNKEQRILDLLCDLPLTEGNIVRLLLHVEIEGEQGARKKVKEPFHQRMHNYACAITLTQKRPFASLAIRTTPQGQTEELFYEMNCFGTHLLFKYPTVFIDKMDEEYLLTKKANPFTLAVLCAKRMAKAGKNENKRYEYAKELLKQMRSAGFSEDTSIRLVQFIEGMVNLNTRKFVKELEKEIDNLLGKEAASMFEVRTPILKKVLERKACEWARAEGIAEGKAEGIAEGKAEGIAEGKAEGKAEGIAEWKIETIRRMFARKMKLDVIAAATGYSVEEVESLVK